MKTPMLVVAAGFAVLVAACGPSGTQTVPNNKPPAPAPVIAPAPAPAKGANLAREYESAYRAASAAVSAMGDTPTAESYAAAGAKVYNALMLGILHERNGHELSQLRSRKEMNETSKLWRSVEGRMSSEDKLRYKNIPEFASAFEAYQKAQASE